MPKPVSILPTSDSLKLMQDYVWQINKERGFNTTDPTKKLLMLTEEVGELAKAVRKNAGLTFTDTTRRTEAAEEIADVLIVLLSLATMLDVDAYEAFLAKETKNRERVWA
jgi:NTP pyrophosphatase (non-canonical NTP hydrolase)